MKKNRLLVAAGLAAAVAIALVMLVLEPVAGGRHYEYALINALSLAALWLLYAADPRTFFGRDVLAFVLVAGLGLGAVNLAVVRTDSEIVKTYQGVFDALEAGQNPYTSGTIYHEIEGVGPVYGNFNYPPLEIYPYYLAYRLAGTWNVTVLVETMILLQALAAMILFRTFRKIRPALLWPFAPMIVLGEVKTTVALTLLVISAVLWLVRKDAGRPRQLHRTLIAILFGLGLMTKFLAAPLMAAYYWHKFDRKDPRTLGRIGVDLSVSFSTAALVMAPFGFVEVLKNTALFNVVLRDRAALTTFYPNVLSGPLSWMGWPAAFPVVAAAIMLFAILAAPRLTLAGALLTAGFAFMLVATTPEPQFIPVLLLIIVFAQGLAVEKAARTGPDGTYARILRPEPKA
jgi:hypothetical protein